MDQFDSKDACQKNVAMRVDKLITCCMIFGIVNSFAQTPTMEDKWWSPESSTYDICVDETNGNVYAVGEFTEVYPPNLRSAFLDKNTGVADENIPRFIYQQSSKVNVAIPDETGGWYFGGRCISPQEPVWRGLTYMDSDGVMSDWNPVISGEIHTMLILGDTLYIGGDFENINGVSRNYLASFDISTGNITDWDPEISDDYDHEVNALTTDGTKIFVGGKFDEAGGQPRSYLAAFDHSSGALTGWAPNQSNAVNAFKLYDEVIYVAPDQGGPSSSAAKAFDSNTGAQTTWSVALIGGYANAIDVIDDMVYIGGDFMVSSFSNYQYNLAVAHPTTGELTFNGFESDGEIFAITSTDQSIFLGGNFSEINGFDRENAAAIDKETGLVNDWDPDANGIVDYLITHEDWVVAAGDFERLGRVLRTGFVELSGETGGPTDWIPEIVIPSGYALGIYEVEIYDNKLFIAGRFNSDYGNNLAVYDLTTKEPIELFDAHPNQLVYSMEFHENKLYIGGKFLSIGSDIRNYLACYDLNTGELTDWAPLPNDEVRSLETKDDQLFIGGEFSLLNGFTRSRLGAVSLIDGTLLPWNPSVGDFGTYINTIFAADDEIFVGGNFEEIGDVDRNMVASLDITTGAVNPWNANIGDVTFNQFVHDIEIVGESVYIGGNFHEVDGNVVYHFAEVNRITGDLSTSTSDLIIGPTGTAGVEAIQISDNKIYLAGKLTLDYLKFNLGVFSPLCNPPVLNELIASQLIVCPGTETELSVSDGELNSASDWIWNSISCDNIEGTTGQVVTVSPMQTTTYYVKSLGGCSEFSENACLSITIEVEEDVTPPEITAPENTILTTDNDECFSSDMVAIGMAVGTDTCSDVEITNDAPDIFPIGQTVVTWFATDESGNVASATQNVIVEDAQAPLIICPDNITIEGDMDDCSAGVTWATPDVTDNCSTEVGISSTYNSGDIFEHGLTGVTYTAVDDSDNSSTCSFEISIVSNFEIDHEIFNTSCANGNDGEINLNIIGEGSAYIVEWSGPAGFSSDEENLIDLDAGIYSVTVTSENGCTRNAEITVSSPQELTFEGTSTPNSTGNNGSISVDVEGGTEPYTFSWTGPDNFTAATQNLENLSESGLYILTVTDSNGCTGNFEIELDSTVGTDDIGWSSVVYPNPLTSVVNFELPSEFIGNTLALYDVTGKVLDQFLIDDVVFTINMERYADGLYFVEVESIGKTFKIVKQ